MSEKRQDKVSHTAPQLPLQLFSCSFLSVLPRSVLHMFPRRLTASSQGLGAAIFQACYVPSPRPRRDQAACHRQHLVVDALMSHAMKDYHMLDQRYDSPHCTTIQIEGV